MALPRCDQVAEAVVGQAMALVVPVVVVLLVVLVLLEQQTQEAAVVVALVSVALAGQVLSSSGTQCNERHGVHKNRSRVACWGNSRADLGYWLHLG
tara:strand:+ start:35 stop:322 length:288 start_codon:yes stop_codon:yes gene_type:complete